MLLNCVVLEKTLESPSDSKEIEQVNPKGNQSWIFIGRPDAEAETPILWPPDAKIWLTGKDPDAGKDWGQEGKGATEYDMVGWHHWLDGHEFEQALGVGDGQASLACCSPWSQELDMTEQLNWTETFSDGKEFTWNARKAGSKRGLEDAGSQGHSSYPLPSNLVPNSVFLPLDITCEAHGFPQKAYKQFITTYRNHTWG